LNHNFAATAGNASKNPRQRNSSNLNRRSRAAAPLNVFSNVLIFPLSSENVIITKKPPICGLLCM
jgi:hypothetical protein